MKKKLRIKWVNIIALILITTLTTIMISSVKDIIEWKLEEKQIHSQEVIIQENVTITEVKDTPETEIIPPPKEKEPEKSNPYWDYIKIDLINVDFNKLKNINKDAKGWIQVLGTNINYPFVQAKDNMYYLNHTFDKSYNSAGWVFLDYRNDLKEKEKNTILYAHGRLDKTMFGSLKNILTSGWLKNEKNYIIKLSTEYEDTLWQVFSVYHIPTTSDYLQINFKDNEEFLSFGNKLLERSSHNFNTELSKEDRILTLSTCFNEDEKVVLHAKLIKKSSR